MSATLLDERQYRELLDVTLPVAIRTEQEYRRLLGATAALMEKPEDKISEEEGRLLELPSTCRPNPEGLHRKVCAGGQEAPTAVIHGSQIVKPRVGFELNSGSSGTRYRNHLSAMTAIDVEVGIRREYQRIGHYLRHAHQARVGKTHR